MKVTIDVTTGDIARGLPNSMAGCPVALAARRVLGSRFDTVGRYLLRLADGTYVFLPGKAVRFVADIDAGNPVRPLRFALKIPDSRPSEEPR